MLRFRVLTLAAVSWSGCCLALQQTSPSIWLSALRGTCALRRLDCFLQCSILPCASADLVHVRCLPERRCKDTTKNRVCQEFLEEIFRKSAFFVIFECIDGLKVLFSWVLAVYSAAKLVQKRTNSSCKDEQKVSLAKMNKGLLQK